MTGNESKAVKFIQNIKDNAVVTLDHIAKEEPDVNPLLYKGRKEKTSTILAMVGELLQYRAIGTAEEITRKLAELERWHTSEVNPDIKNVFANMSTQICHNCDHKDEYIVELEAEIEQYRAIGTVEECRAAVEKQKPKKPTEQYKLGTSGRGGKCPLCKHYLDRDLYVTYCDCGQRLDWSSEE